MVTQHIVGGRYAGTIFRGFTRSGGRCRGFGHVGAGGGRAVWCQRQHGDALGLAVACRGPRPGPPDGGDRRSRLTEHRTMVLELIAKQPDLTLQEIRGALAAGHRITIGLTSVWRFLKGHKVTLKKRACTPPSRIVPT